MAIVNWPTSLRGKRPLRNGFRLIPSSPRVDVEMEGGSIFARLASYKSKDILVCPFYMTDVEFATFEDFYEGDLKYGINSLSWTHFITGGYAEYKIIGDYTFTVQGPTSYVVTVTLQLENVRVDDPTEGS